MSNAAYLGTAGMLDLTGIFGQIFFVDSAIEKTIKKEAHARLQAMSHQRHLIFNKKRLRNLC